MAETKAYECNKCKDVREEEEWEAPTFNGFAQTGTLKFFPESFKCDCGGKFYEQGVNPFGDGSSNLKYDHKGGVNVYEQVRNRPRGGI